MEAISHAGSAMGILTSEGIVLVAEKKVPSKLLERAKAEKMYKIDSHIASSVAGITADANILVNQCRLYSQQHFLKYQEPILVETLVQNLCDLKQGYTQYGGA
jgi:20S proteasome subunit alpha 3